jgi:hypothetical protein
MRLVLIAVCYASFVAAVQNVLIAVGASLDRTRTLVREQLAAARDDWLTRDYQRPTYGSDSLTALLLVGTAPFVSMVAIGALLAGLLHGHTWSFAIIGLLTLGCLSVWQAHLESTETETKTKTKDTGLLRQVRRLTARSNGEACSACEGTRIDLTTLRRCSQCRRTG